MRTVYVVTTEPGARARTVRAIAFLIIARIVVTLAAVGHVIVQLAGALDAYVTAVLGVPRLAVLGRRVRAALRETWEA
ncbi:hypothetical protein AB0L53_54840 [Nonomuraea sp. NPDC052129]|uniref:hypothetical protein n=1 Tax=Nonomuraea sp. NPDC052129 TaxID=3154651 RepID=UPI003412F9D7